MPRHHRQPPRLSRFPLSVELAVEIARIAAEGHPALIVLLLDNSGWLIACRPHDLAPGDIEESCRTLLGLLASESPEQAYLVSVDPGFGTETAPATAVWPELERTFTEAGATLLDWLLVCDESVASVAAAASSVAASRR